MIEFISGTDEAQERIRFLGKRVERIIFVGVIFALISVSLYLIATEIKNKSSDDINLAFELIQKCVEDNKSEMIDRYSRFEKYGKTISEVDSRIPSIVYSMRTCYTGLLNQKESYKSDSAALYRVYKSLEKYLDNVQPMPFEKIAPFLSNIREKVLSEPLRVQGVEVKNEVKIDLLGNSLKTDFSNLVSKFGFVYFATLMLWFFTFKRSRTTELLAIKNDAEDYSWIYPHILNSFDRKIKNDNSLIDVDYEDEDLNAEVVRIFCNFHLMVRIFFHTLLLSFTFGPFFAALITLSVSTYSFWHVLSIIQLGVFFFVAVYVERVSPTISSKAENTGKQEGKYDSVDQSGEN